MTKRLHRVHHKHVAGEGMESWITCDGDRNADCHFYPDPDSEAWEDGWTELERILNGFSHDECIYVLTAKAWECAQLCAPDGEPVRNGPIIPVWDVDCMAWEYVEEETPDA